MIVFLIAFVALSNYGVLHSNCYKIKNIEFNLQQFRRHKTIQFYRENNGASKVIIRRGDYFQFSVDLRNSIIGDKILTVLSFSTRIDRMVVNLSPESGQKGWSLKQVKTGNRINARIYVPANAPVGVWNLKILLRNKRGRIIEQVNSPHKIVVLFNPWSKADPAYFPQQQKLSEYLFNERGYTYSYDYYTWQKSPWIFGQFQSRVLDAILLALSKAKLNAFQRGDIVLVTRELTNLMSDDAVANRGVLQGRWKGPYGPLEGRPATRPWRWTGSPAIFLQYLQYGGKPVGYGQCWVFAAILTTSLRALGIASRPVSNFVSAHSFNKITNKRDLTVDIYLDERGNIKHEDMVWNFHVWVQAWFNRQIDIGYNYGGWQELDATPQEKDAFGRFNIGPASNLALRNSQLLSRFDTAFLYEAVNADEVVWSSRGKILSIDRHKVGKAVVTKQYGGDGIENITWMYKPSENTAAELQSYRRAAQSLGIRPPSITRVIPRSVPDNVFTWINITKQIFLGSTVSSKIYIKNPSKTKKNLEVSIKAYAMHYNGIRSNVLKIKTFKKAVEALKITIINFDIKPENYIGKLEHLYTIRIETVVKQGDVINFYKKYISLSPPKLTVLAPKLVVANRPFFLYLQFKNPFNRKLTNCSIALEGIRIRRNEVHIKDISPNSFVNISLKLQTSSSDVETVVIHFNSKRLIHLQSSIQFNVDGKPRFEFAARRIRDIEISSELPRSNGLEMKGEIISNSEEEEEEAEEDNEIIRYIDEDSFECCNILEIP